MTARFGDLLAELEHEVFGHFDPDHEPTAITADSRRVVPGGVFVALRGGTHDGHQHIGEAVTRGAAIIVVESGTELELPPAMVVVKVAATREAYARLLGRFWRHPDRNLEVIAVTGTNGKTTVSHLVRDLLRAGGVSCGLIGTIRYETPSTTRDAPLTTPATEDLYALLAEMRDGQAGAVAMEASSHALDQRRLAAIEVDVAAFTNLTHEHLDYHGTLERYLAAKRLLLDHLAGPRRAKAPGRAVVNRDALRLAACEWPAHTVFTGSESGCTVRLEDAQCTREGIRIRARIDECAVTLHSRLLGRYNVENLLVTAGIGMALGLDAAEIARRFPLLEPVPGRLEPVHVPGAPLLLVDYAHTPDGIGSALRAVRELDCGPVTIVFGCGGDRDRSKRPLMAEAALAGADRVVLTLDNPRTEDPERIFADAESGFAGERKRAERIPDRQEAIAHALTITPDHGVVLVAGKGHEHYQIIGTERVPWDDRAALRAAWSARGGS